MLGLSPYAMIAGGVAVLGVLGGFYYEDRQVHHWHSQYDELHTADTKVIQNLKDTIQNMVAAQAKQSDTTAKNVTKLVEVPGPTKTIVKTIHDAPLPANCGTPVLTEEDRNAF
jgi:hypothetical protein